MCSRYESHGTLAAQSCVHSLSRRLDISTIGRPSLAHACFCLHPHALPPTHTIIVTRCTCPRHRARHPHSTLLTQGHGGRPHTCSTNTASGLLAELCPEGVAAVQDAVAGLLRRGKDDPDEGPSVSGNGDVDAAMAGPAPQQVCTHHCHSLKYSSGDGGEHMAPMHVFEWEHGQCHSRWPACMLPHTCIGRSLVPFVWLVVHVQQGHVVMHTYSKVQAPLHSKQAPLTSCGRSM